MKLLILSLVWFSYEALAQINISRPLGVETFASTDVPAPLELLPLPTQAGEQQVLIQTQSASMVSSETNSLSNFNHESFENAISKPPTQKLSIEAALDAALDAPVWDSNQDTQSKETRQDSVEPTNTIDPSLADNNSQYLNQQNASEESQTIKTAIIISVSLAIVGIAVGGIFYGIPKFIKISKEDINLTNPDWEAINQSRKQGQFLKKNYDF